MKKYDLVDRCQQFQEDVILLCKRISENAITNPLVDLLIRSSNAVGANYIETDEALSKKDFVYRLKLARKEAKESMFHLRS